jgi:hypothetical protein
MPPAGTAANYAPTGAIARVEIPQEMLDLSAINTNDLNSVVWQVWNDIYTGTISITSNNAAITPQPNIITASTSYMPTTSGATPNEVWTAWNVQLTVAVNSAITSHIGQPINAATTSSLTNTINGEIWGAWNNQIQNLRNASAEQVRRVQEQQRQARERQDRYQADQTRVQVERSKAEKRAEKLLQELLSAEQRAELAAKGFFTLRTIAKSGEERIYRIRRGRSRNVEQVDAQGNRIKTLCAHPIEMVPDADTMLAQKLMLETPDMQEEFLRIANHS